MKGTIAKKGAGRMEESWAAAADLSNYQYYFLKADSNGRAAVITAVTDVAVGILDNDPAALDRGARLIHGGITKLKTDGSSTNISRGDWLAPNSTGLGVKDLSNRAIAMALQPSTASGVVISVLLLLHPFRVQSDHLYIYSDPNNKKQVRIGSEVSTQTSDTHMGFSCKPDLEGSGTATCTGAEFSPRVSGGAAFADMMGLNINPDIKADAGDASGEYRGVQIKMEANTNYTGTITGDVMALKIVPSIHGNTTITGDYSAVVIQDGTQAGAGKNWDAAFKIGGDGGIAATTGTPSTQSGFIKVIIGTTDKYIRLYTSA